MLSVLAMLATLLLLLQVRIASCRYSTKFFVTLFVLIISFFFFFFINLTFQIRNEERQMPSNVSRLRLFFLFTSRYALYTLHRARVVLYSTLYFLSN